MVEAYVQLLCPQCSKFWEANPSDLPAHNRQFRCPDCDTSRSTAEFMRTERDLETLKRLTEET